MKSQHKAHLVPADSCASLMLAIGWETARSDQRQRYARFAGNISNILLTLHFQFKFGTTDLQLRT